MFDLVLDDGGRVGLRHVEKLVNESRRIDAVLILADRCRPCERGEEEEEDTFEAIMYRILERFCPFTDMIA